MFKWISSLFSCRHKRVSVVRKYYQFNPDIIFIKHCATCDACGKVVSVKTESVNIEKQ